MGPVLEIHIFFLNAQDKLKYVAWAEEPYVNDIQVPFVYCPGVEQKKAYFFSLCHL